MPKEIFNPQKLILSVINKFELAANARDLYFDMTLQNAPDAVIAAHPVLRHMIEGLLGALLKHPGPGKINFELESDLNNKHALTLIIEHSNWYVPPEDISCLFNSKSDEANYSLETDLRMIRLQIGQLRGKLHVESTSKQGIAFIITIPVCYGEPRTRIKLGTVESAQDRR